MQKWDYLSFNTTLYYAPKHKREDEGSFEGYWLSIGELSVEFQSGGRPGAGTLAAFREKLCNVLGDHGWEIIEAVFRKQESSRDHKCELVIQIFAKKPRPAETPDHKLNPLFEGLNGDTSYESLLV